MIENCMGCGRFVSRATAGRVETEVSHLDGVICIVSMWCHRCAGEIINISNTDDKINMGGCYGCIW